MPLDPNALAQAFVATPFAVQPIFGDGRGFIPLSQGPYFVKFLAVGGATYTVGENEIPGNLVVFGPNGQPITPGIVPGTDQTISFTPPSSGVYLVEIVPHPQTVVAHQEVVVTIQANELGLTDPTLGGGINTGPTSDPSNSLAGRVLSGQLGGVNPPATTVQYVLHPRDGDPNGLANGIAAPEVPLSGDAGAAAPITAAPTPLETANGGKPITYVGATDAPGMPGDPTRISIAPALTNYPSDSSLHVGFSSPLTQPEFKLLIAAAHIWEVAANVRFDFLADVPADSGTVQKADIRVGLADIQASLGRTDMQLLGDTEYKWDANNKFETDNLVAIEDPHEHSTTPLADGDEQYSGTQATMFQAMIRELGHAIGLGDNPSDPNSIMNPHLTAANRLPDGNDIAAVQSLYGAAKSGPVFGSQDEITFLQNLVNNA